MRWGINPNHRTGISFRVRPLQATPVYPSGLRVIVTPAVYPRLFELLHFDIQSTGQKSRCVNTGLRPSHCSVLIKQSDSPCPFSVLDRYLLHDAPPIFLRARLPLPPSARRPPGGPDTASRRRRSGPRDGRVSARAGLAFGVRAPESKVRLDQCVSREPILFPKLRIDFADFPCLHCSISARGYSPRRPAAVDRYALARDSTALARIFTRRPGGTGRRPARTSLFGRAVHRFSARRDSAVDVLLATLPRKDSSSRAPRSSSPGVFASPPGPSASRRRRPSGQISVSRLGNRCPIPFRSARDARARQGRARRPRCVAALAATLRRGYTTIDRRSRGTLLHFGLRGFRLNVCYYHQDLHRRPLQPSSRPAFDAIGAPAYSNGLASHS